MWVTALQNYCASVSEQPTVGDIEPTPNEPPTSSSQIPRFYFGKQVGLTDTFSCDIVDVSSTT
jgi:hypothetical protein